MTPERLRQCRKDLKLTQAQLARELCVTRRAVVSWETGTRNMPPTAEKLFCILYDLPFQSPDVDLIEDLTPDLF